MFLQKALTSAGLGKTLLASFSCGHRYPHERTSPCDDVEVAIEARDSWHIVTICVSTIVCCSSQVLPEHFEDIAHAKAFCDFEKAALIRKELH